MLQRHLSPIVSLCLVALLTPALLAGDWPQFRGPGGLGISPEKNLPITWTETENIAWKTPLPGYGSSSPIALNGKLYVHLLSPTKRKMLLAKHAKNMKRRG